MLGTESASQGLRGVDEEGVTWGVQILSLCVEEDLVGTRRAPLKMISTPSSFPFMMLGVHFIWTVTSPVDVVSRGTLA